MKESGWVFGPLFKGFIVACISGLMTVFILYVFAEQPPKHKAVEQVDDDFSKLYLQTDPPLPGPTLKMDTQP